VDTEGTHPRLMAGSSKIPASNVADDTQPRPHGSSVSLTRYIANARPLVVLTAPLVYSMILPFALLDLAVTLYQLVCFPVYGIARVRRADYLIFDRARLPYLNLLEKLNCAYCSYANGVIGYVREVAGRSEQYWCAIEHSRAVPGPHAHYREFTPYGDAGAFEAKRATLRDTLSH
jgi:hypothetical protein